MDVLIYHVELLEQSFPDCCVRCGANNTELQWVDRQYVTFTAGNTYRYSEICLPFCPAHVKPPLVSLKYPGVKSVTSEGLVIKNVSPQFVEALQAFRTMHPPMRTPRADIPIVTPDAIQRGERAYRRFAAGMIIAAIVFFIVAMGIALGWRFWKSDSPEKTPPPRDTTHDLDQPNEFGPPGFPKGSKLNQP